MAGQLTAYTCDEFCDRLASHDPVPGGGGSAAMVGAIAAALASMVANFTRGKARYAAVADDIEAILAAADAHRLRLLELVQADADVFEPLSSAYAIPKDDPARTDAVERELKAACEPAHEMMEEIAQLIALFAELRTKGSREMRSDVGCGALYARAALRAAAYVIYADAALLNDRDHAARLTARADELLMTYAPQAEAIADEVLTEIRERPLNALSH